MNFRGFSLRCQPITHDNCGRSFRTVEAFDRHLPCAAAEAQLAMLREVAAWNRAILDSAGEL